MTDAPTPLTVWFDDDCGLCGTAVRWAATRTGPDVVWRPNRELADPVLAGTAADAIVVTMGASAWSGVEAVGRILARTGLLGRLTSRLLDLPGVRALAGAGYRWVAAHRAAISARLGLTACAVRPVRTYDPPGR